jgi:hypothetical protein
MKRKKRLDGVGAALQANDIKFRNIALPYAGAEFIRHMTTNSF